MSSLDDERPVCLAVVVLVSCERRYTCVRTDDVKDLKGCWAGLLFELCWTKDVTLNI